MLPVPPSALLVSWGNAALAGRVSPDTAADRIVGRGEPHRVVGLPGADGRDGGADLDRGGDGVSLPLALPLLRRLGVRGLRLALPVPGDVSGLPGPPAFNAAALEAGEAVLTVGGPPLGLVPQRTARLVWHTVHVASARLAGPSLAEAERELKECLADATATLVRLDVAKTGTADTAGGAGLAQVLAELRDDRGMSAALSPGYPPRAAAVLALARQVAGTVAIAARDDGAAVSAGEAARRTTALTALRVAARRAQVAAFNAPLELARS